MKAGRKTGSSGKGEENRKTPERERCAAEAVAAIVVSEPTIVWTDGETSRAKVEVACPGITAKALLLTVMRNAWEDAHREADEAEELAMKAAALEQEAATQTLQPRESLADFHGRRAITREAAKQIRSRASTLRLEVRDDITFAAVLARTVLPYEHPKLMRIVQTVTVIYRDADGRRGQSERQAAAARG